MKIPFWQLLWAGAGTIEEWATETQANARQRILARQGILAIIGKVEY